MAVKELLDRLYVLQIQQFVWDAPSNTEDGLQDPEFRSEVERTLLAPDQAEVRVTIWLEGLQTGEELFIGKPHETADGQFYARRGGIPAVFTLPAALVDNVSNPVNTFRAKQVLPPNWDKTHQLSIEYQDARLVLSNALNRGSWDMLEPVHVPANPDKVKDLLRTFSKLQYASFEETLSYDSERPVLTVGIGVADPQTKETVRFILQLQSVPANDQDLRWIGRMGEDSVWLPVSGFVTENVLHDLLTPSQYRTLSIFALPATSVNWIQRSTAGSVVTMELVPGEERTAWKVVEPASRNLDTNALRRLLAVLSRLRADEVVALDPPSLEPFGLHAPETTISMRFADASQLQRSLLLSRCPSEDVVYALQQGYGFVYKLRPDDIPILEGRLLLPEESMPVDGPVELGSGINATSSIPVLPVEDTNESE
jgi:hypothetical protein